MPIRLPRYRSPARLAPLAILVALVLAGLGAAAVQTPARASAEGPGDTVVAAAGDISPAGIGAQRRTAALAASWHPAAVLALGDLQYPEGSLADFQAYYDPTWGQLKAVTRPVPGNHEYKTTGGAGYAGYFGQQATPTGHYYYSFDLAGWHLVALNSEADHSSASVQVDWLRDDLAKHPNSCVLAYWHRPRFSSGRTHGSDSSMVPFWAALERVRADLVLNGHDHVYERFAPQHADATPATDGIREFVVGTGGAGVHGFTTPAANSEVRLGQYHGVLKLTLRPGSYDWAFQSSDGQVRDSGSAACSA